MRKNKKRTRKIPKEISDAVKQRHFFECAWCGVKIYERHHIQEFHLGGEHSEHNLILLCPNHHTMAHSGEINRAELVTRKSTHVKGDRLTGDFKTTTSDLKVSLCGGIAINTPNLLSHNGYPILRIYKENENILIDSKFYNQSQELVFWMSRSMYWSHINAIISPPKIDFLEIKNDSESIYLRIDKKRNDETLDVVMKTYLGGELVTFNEEFAQLNGFGSVSGSTMTNCDAFINYMTY